MKKGQIYLDYNNMMAGRTAGGITEAELAGYLPQLTAAAARLAEGAGRHPFRAIPFGCGEMVRKVKETAAFIRQGADAFVVLGIGGSALGPMYLHRALGHLRHNELPGGRRDGPKVYFEDNIDPERMASLLDIIDLHRTCFNIISKTGTTTETTAQVMAVCAALRRAGLPLQDHVVVTTDPAVGSMRAIARDEGLRTLDIPPELQGRFCNLTPIGLLPAAVIGADIDALLAGAADLERMSGHTDVMGNVAYADGALQYIAYRRGAKVSVIMPYAESLKYFADVYTILWGESLSSPSIEGQIPIKALGVTDQHAQLQLYLQSPRDKVLTTIVAERYPARVELPGPALFPQVGDMDYLRGRTLEELIRAEHFGNCYALAQEGCLNKTIVLPEISAYTVGQLLEMVMVETVYLAELMGVDPYNCPAYDHTKGMTSAAFQRRGYEQYTERYGALPGPDAKYMVTGACVK